MVPRRPPFRRQNGKKRGASCRRGGREPTFPLGAVLADSLEPTLPHGAVFSIWIKPALPPLAVLPGTRRGGNVGSSCHSDTGGGGDVGARISTKAARPGEVGSQSRLVHEELDDGALPVGVRRVLPFWRGHRWSHPSLLSRSFCSARLFNRGGVTFILYSAW